jgi:hypothetical protein
MSKPNLDLPSIEDIEFEIRELPPKNVTSVEKQALQKRFDFLEKKNKELSETNRILDERIYEMEGIISKFKKELEEKEQLYKRLKRIFDFVTNVSQRDRKQKEYYKLLNLWLMKKKFSDKKDYPKLKQKLTAIENENKHLEVSNKKLQEEYKKVSNILEKIRSEFDAKKNFFEEQDKKVKEIKKKAIQSLTNYQVMKEKNEEIEKRYKEVLARNSFLEEKTREHMTLLKQLKERLLEERTSTTEDIEMIKKQYEDKIKQLIEQNNNTEIALRSQIKILKAQLERQKHILKEKDRREKEIISNVSEKLKFLIQE